MALKTLKPYKRPPAGKKGAPGQVKKLGGGTGPIYAPAKR